jgi:hypothetical protein
MTIKQWLSDAFYDDYGQYLWAKHSDGNQLIAEMQNGPVVMFIGNKFGINTNDAIIGGCDAAQIGAISQAIQIAKQMNHPVEKIWLDGGNAKVLAQAMMKSEIPGAFAVETIEGLVLRGTWAWLLQNL